MFKERKVAAEFQVKECGCSHLVGQWLAVFPLLLGVTSRCRKNRSAQKDESLQVIPLGMPFCCHLPSRSIAEASCSRCHFAARLNAVKCHQEAVDSIAAKRETLRRGRTAQPCHRVDAPPRRWLPELPKREPCCRVKVLPWESCCCCREEGA